MRKENITAAKAEAKRFLARLAVLEGAQGKEGKWHSWEAPKERGALRRASMDLTRALAEMRKP
jgi:hypothetical protein